MTHPHAEWTRARLEAYIGTTETLTLEFKSIRSPIVDDKKDKEAKLSEAARDVAGMANEQGGYIIYGIEEESRGVFKRAKAIEEGFGVEHTVSREWLLQFIRDRVQPPLNDIDAVDVPLGNERFALVVMVPQARGVARQTGDHLFWRRDAQGLSPMTVQQIEDVHARAVRPRLELRAPTSPGRVLPDDQVEIDFGLQVYNPSSSVASFAVVTLGFGRLVSAQFLSGPEWRWDQTMGDWKVARTVIASGSSSRWSPITPRFTMVLQRLTVLTRLLQTDYIRARLVALARLDHDGGTRVYRITFSAEDLERDLLQLELFKGADDPILRGISVPDLFLPD